MDKEDTSLIHAVDTFREGVELAHPDLVETLADEAPHAIDDLLRR
jgi:succinate dehydrogenase/fumarate reductase flavoprotein subunit